MRDLKQYIAINRWFMTTKEMAEELGVPMYIVNNTLSKNKWKAVNDSERIREYLSANPGADYKEVATMFGKTLQLVYKIAKELKEEGFVAPQKIASPEPEPVDPGPLSEQRKEWLEWAADEGYGVTPKPREDRLKEAYTQSGSPYGFADELRKIKTRG